MKKITPEEIKKMSYVDLMAFLEEVNRPPGCKNSVRILVQNCFITKDSKVLDVGCNTGYVSFEIAHLTKCSVVGVDINENMIRAAEKIRKRDPLGHLVKFKVVDAMNLPFPEETFDAVVSGGSTAFINDKIKALQEYKRVLKQWGFVADINFFYKKKPPASLLKKLNSILEIKIEPWDINYWMNLYEKAGLEKYFIYVDQMQPVSCQAVQNYCSVMANEKQLPRNVEVKLKERLLKIMSVFNENHKYLSYGVFIFRKRPEKEQISFLAHKKKGATLVDNPLVLGIAATPAAMLFKPFLESLLIDFQPAQLRKFFRHFEGKSQGFVQFESVITGNDVV